MTENLPPDVPPAPPAEPPPAPDYGAPVAPPPAPLSPADERTWSMLAHLSNILNVTGFLGVVAAIVIYLVYKDRSRRVAYHAMQSFIFQLIMLGITIVAVIISASTIACLIGAILMPLAFLVPLISIVYSVIGGLKCNQGEDFEYWLVGDWTRKILHNG